jgi:monosaccharide-transporting ATPase
VSDQAPLLSMRGISKAFPGVQALTDVDFDLYAGEIRAIVGENGAGKSTLIKVLTGVERPDTGQMTFAGERYQVHSPQHAQQLGISTVYQEVNLCPNLTVAENVLIGRAPMRWGITIDWNRMNRQAREIMAGLDLDIDVTRPLGSYSVAVQQMVAIARALDISSAKVLILDEPTSSLTLRETQQLFEVMHTLRAEGIAIVFITHFLDQVYEVSDRVTILRNGEVVGTYDPSSLPRLELVSLMLGRSLADLDDMAKHKMETLDHISEEAFLQARGLGMSGSVQPFDLDLHKGEVVGLAGLLGSGRTEVARLLFGLDRPDSGTLDVAGSAVDDFSPAASIKRGIALAPEDRAAEGIVADLSVRDNIILAVQANRGWLRHISAREAEEIADRFIRLLHIATPSSNQAVKNLSGGNQQKVILARWLATDPQLLILDEPTRGIDVGTKADIQKLVLDLAEEGKSCVFISSELDEVLRTSHRIVVLRDRAKATEITGDVDEKELMTSIAGTNA